MDMVDLTATIAAITVTITAIWLLASGSWISSDFLDIIHTIMDQDMEDQAMEDQDTEDMDTEDLDMGMAVAAVEDTGSTMPGQVSRWTEWVGAFIECDRTLVVCACCLLLAGKYVSVRNRPW
jgi:hypothetical protein